MKLSLGIDTSGTPGSAALLTGSGPGDCLSVTFQEGLIHGVALAPSCRDLLAEAGITASELGLIAVGIGPGSYTGIRVGVSFAKSLAFATGVPVVSVSSLLAMAASAPAGGSIVCARDARRDALYLAVYHAEEDALLEVTPPSLVPLSEVPGLLPDGALVLGDALTKHSELLSGGGRTAGEERLWHTPAATVARLGAALLRERGGEDPHDLAPLYLRASEAEERMSEKSS